MAPRPQSDAAQVVAYISDAAQVVAYTQLAGNSYTIAAASLDVWSETTKNPNR